MNLEMTGWKPEKSRIKPFQKLQDQNQCWTMRKWIAKFWMSKPIKIFGNCFMRNFVQVKYQMSSMTLWGGFSFHSHTLSNSRLSYSILTVSMQEISRRIKLWPTDKWYWKVGMIASRYGILCLYSFDEMSVHRYFSVYAPMNLHWEVNFDFCE